MEKKKPAGFPAGLMKKRPEMPPKCGELGAEIKALLLGLGALGIGLRLAARLLRGRFEGAQAAHFVHNPLGFEFGFETL